MFGTWKLVVGTPPQVDRMSFDVIIVGARCAGASLATLLARRGARVLADGRAVGVRINSPPPAAA